MGEAKAKGGLVRDSGCLHSFRIEESCQVEWRKRTYGSYRGNAVHMIISFICPRLHVTPICFKINYIIKFSKIKKKNYKFNSKNHTSNRFLNFLKF